MRFTQQLHILATNSLHSITLDNQMGIYTHLLLTGLRTLGPLKGLHRLGYQQAYKHLPQTGVHTQPSNRPTHASPPTGFQRFCRQWAYTYLATNRPTHNWTPMGLHILGHQGPTQTRLPSGPPQALTTNRPAHTWHPVGLHILVTTGLQTLGLQWPRHICLGANKPTHLVTNWHAETQPSNELTYIRSPAGETCT